MSLVVGQENHLHAVNAVLGKVRLVPGHRRANCTIVSIVTGLHLVSVDICIPVASPQMFFSDNNSEFQTMSISDGLLTNLQVYNTTAVRYSKGRYSKVPATTLLVAYRSQPSLALWPATNGHQPTDVLPPAWGEIQFIRVFLPMSLSDCRFCQGLLTVNQLTSYKSGTGYVWHGPVNRNCSHLQPPTSYLSTVLWTSTA